MDISALQTSVAVTASDKVNNNSVVQAGTETTPDAETKDKYSSALADIAAKYDVRNITPRQAADMEKELYANGLLSIKDLALMELHYAKFEKLPTYEEYCKTKGNRNPNEIIYDRPDEPRDMLADFKKAVAFQRTTETANNVQHVVDELELIESTRSKSFSSKTAVTTQSVVNVQAATSSYADAISKTTVNSQSVMNVLEALASHKQR